MKITDLSNGDTSKLVTYSNPELLLLSRFKRFDLHPTFVVAVEEELAKRTITSEDIEAYKKIENREIRRANEFEQKEKRQENYGGIGLVFLLISFLIMLTIYFAFFGIITYGIGIYYISNSNYTRKIKVLCIASPILLMVIVMAAIGLL